MNLLLSPQNKAATLSLVPKFATGANVIPVATRFPLGRDAAAETRAEPEGDTTLARATTSLVGTGDLPQGAILPTDNGASLDNTTMRTEREPRGRKLPKRGSRSFCGVCPGLPSFATKGALKKHKKQAHNSSAPQCPICPARIPKQPLAKHLKRVHGITDVPAVETVPLTTLASTHSDTKAVELLHERAHHSDDTNVFDTNEATSERVYCQEHDCGRGFSSERNLESHIRFFHSTRVTQEQEASPSSKCVVERSSEPRLLEAYYPPTSMTIPPLIEEGVRNPDPHSFFGISIPSFGGGRQDTASATLLAENFAGQTRPAFEPSTSIQGSADPQPRIPSLVLPLRCRMCDAPPTVMTQPAVTTCGHLFCFECIAQHVASTSRCPVCWNALLLYCLFKLDLSGVS